MVPQAALPEILPDSSADSPATGTRKKVNWASNSELTSSPAIPTIQSSGGRKPIKSILKPYNGTINVKSNINSSTKLSHPHSYPTLAAMLESVAQQLAGEDRNSKMDAYTTLSSSIKASDNIPELRALKEKMAILLQFMKRDLTAKTATGSWDNALIVHDLTLLASFLHKPAVAEHLNSDFGAFVVDHSTKTFEDPGMSKDIVKHLMFILAQQNLHPKVLTAERVSKLVKALHDIEKFVKGKSIVTGRLDIYRNLIRNARSHMLVTTEWLDDLFSGMLNSQKDTRAVAIELGLEAALVLGTEVKMARTITEFLNREGNGATHQYFADYLAQQLKHQVGEKQESSAVTPRIWSVPILFLRSKPRQLEQWPYLKPWLKVIQKCFNSSDLQTKLEANLAWNRVVYAVQPDEKTSRTFIGMLCRPLLEQLKRKNQLAKGRKAALSSVCVLLYYSLKPQSTAAQLDLYWKEYVTQLISNALVVPKASNSTEALELIEPSRSNLLDCCRILKCLFDSTTPRPWKETRAIELVSPESVMEMTELPALDSKWLRKSAPLVFPVIDTLLEKLYWDLSNDMERVSVMWKTYITSIASPAVKEIKVSNETMSCIAYIFNFLYRIWRIGPNSIKSLSATNGYGNFLGSFGNIILTTIEGVGLLPFTEKLLSVGNQDTFTVIATPSHGNKGARGEVRSPLHHLFVLLTSLCPGLDYDSRYSHLIRQVLTPFFKARPTSKAKTDLVKDLLQLLPAESTESSRVMWQVLAEFAAITANVRDANGTNSAENDQCLGVDYRSSLEILEVGIDLSPTTPLLGWQKVFDALITSSTLDAGDGGRAIAVVEPIARSFVAKATSLHNPPPPGISYCRIVVSSARYPKDRQSLDAARKRLWGVTTAPSKTFAHDPYIQLYEFLRICLQTSYDSYSNDRALQCADLISATASLLTRCPSSILLNLLKRLQEGFGCWIMDRASKIGGGTQLSQAVTNFWGRLCSSLPSLKILYCHNNILADLEPLFLAGLESKHRTIVVSTIRLWNATFGDCDTKLDYSPRITQALSRLLPAADLRLPFFPENLDLEWSNEDRQPITFDTQDDDTNLWDSILARPAPSIPAFRARRSTPQVIVEVKKSITAKRPREETPEIDQRKSKKRVSTPMLRHDDSQIHFETIESSPIPDMSVPESQLLTERQKEVKERQQAEAAMFPDIRSSPRPRERSIPRRSESVDLPFLRSSSKPRAASSPPTERQTTPVLAPQAEEDDYVNSSPTPTREVNEANDDDEMEDIAKASLSPLNLAEEFEEPDVPSSPPEMIEVDNEDSVTSLDPSAQIDSLSTEFNLTVSSVEFTPEEQHKSTISDSFEKIDDTAEPGKPIILKTTPIPTDNEVQVRQGGTTSITPDQSPKNSTPMPLQTPKLPIYHDALSSPTSSDQNYGDEVFEDAVSSPNIELDIPDPKKASSPLSDLDESSMMRMMTKFDQSSGRLARNVKLSIENEEEMETALTGAISSSVEGSFESPSGATHNISAQSHDLMDIDAPEGDGEAQELVSPIPSLIPETPGARPQVPMIIINGEQYDPNDTIVVSIPADFHAYPKKSRKRRFGSSPRKRASIGRGPGAPSPLSQKWKEEAVERNGEKGVPDSQEGPTGISISTTQDLPKRKPGRPKGTRSSSARESRSQSQSQSQSQVESSQESVLEESFMSTDMDASSQSLEAPRVSLFSSVELDPHDNEITVSENVAGGVLDVEDELPRISRKEESLSVEDSDVKLYSIIETSDSNDLELVEETTIERSSSSHAPGVVVTKAETGLQGSIEGIVEGKLQTMDAAVQSEVSLKDRFKSVIEGLKTACLPKEEVLEIEDMFMEFKEHLYGAARRGRN